MIKSSSLRNAPVERTKVIKSTVVHLALYFVTIKASSPKKVIKARNTATMHFCCFVAVTVPNFVSSECCKILEALSRSMAVIIKHLVQNLAGCSRSW